MTKIVRISDSAYRLIMLEKTAKGLKTQEEALDSLLKKKKKSTQTHNLIKRR